MVRRRKGRVQTKGPTSATSIPISSEFSAHDLDDASRDQDLLSVEVEDDMR
jgi:hypothetical protein